ncbi:MAG TPA: prolipoprotein diacylglyceryl transferase [Firmicutes bacterium]|nr:prolipoprotein diacylglyceryl transferase [Bacillota bacterium]
MNPELINIFGISIKWYSCLILAGVLIAYILANKESKKFNLPKDFIFDMVFWVVIFGIIGARLYYVIFNFDLYKNNLLDIFKVWNGGLAIHGGIIAGLITLLVYCKKKEVKPLRIMDIAVPSLIIAQAIGRWGNFFNSEAHGPATSLLNLQNLHIPSFIIKGMNINGIYYHPTFLYESLWCVMGFIVLILIRKFYKYLKSGQLTCVYLMWYSIGRFFIESLRTDSLMIGGFKAAQLMSIIMFIVGFICFVYLCFNRLKKGQYYDKKEMRDN